MNLMSDISIYGYLFQYLNTTSQAVLNLYKDSLFFFSSSIFLKKLLDRMGFLVLLFNEREPDKFTMQGRVLAGLGTSPNTWTYRRGWLSYLD